MSVSIVDGLLELVEKSLGVKYHDWPAEVLAVAAARVYGHGYLEPPISIALVNSRDPEYVVSLAWKSGSRSLHYYRVNAREKTGQFLGNNIPLKRFCQ